MFQQILNNEENKRANIAHKMIDGKKKPSQKKKENKNENKDIMEKQNR